jgi:hypothetical protein
VIVRLALMIGAVNLMSINRTSTDIFPEVNVVTV